jgi:hypothetical protein
MTFGPHHYVPFLKAKRGEKTALRQVSADLRERITPLFEIPERNAEKNLAKHLDTAFDGLAETAALYPRCFLDTREIAPDGSNAAASVFQRAADAGMVFTPVTGISRTADVAEALVHRTFGVALRLTREEFESGELTARIEQFVVAQQIQPEDMDLIIDLGAVDDLVLEGISALAGAFMADVPYRPRWRTFTISACSFPLSMGGVDRHSHDFVERSEWLAWRDGLYGTRNSLGRLPTFSDCAIQHPRGVEGFDPRIMQVSATIRYTLQEQWLLVKGEGTRAVPPSIQFPQLATRLVYGHLHNHYAGENHCAGCAGIKHAADGAPKYGSAEVWRRIGTVHHISTVIQTLDSLTWP